mmetsp:Transcript_107396/g.300758  ORF Transcript_107396/g.300758 Transcript_107396/m.300758 type:complete len:195 (+) Transcript_107396:676-1260(+)
MGRSGGPPPFHHRQLHGAHARGAAAGGLRLPVLLAQPRRQLAGDVLQVAEVSGEGRLRLPRLEGVLQAAFTAHGRFPPCLPGADPQRPCSGSGDAPCADVVDCAKPLGKAMGPGPAACGAGERSAFADLAAIARVVAGATEAEATKAFRAILAASRPVAPAPRAEKAGSVDLGSGAPRRPLPVLALLGLAALRL